MSTVFELWTILTEPASFQSSGGVGISNMIHKMEQHEYMGFENLCKYDA